MVELLHVISHSKSVPRWNCFTSLVIVRECSRAELPHVISHSKGLFQGGAATRH